MKKFLFTGLISVAICGSLLAQNFVHSSDYGFTIIKPVASTYTWTNDNAYPFKIASMICNSSVANTTLVTKVHEYKVNQEVGNIVTTNYGGTVETNYSHQVTNVLTTCVTNILLSTTNSGENVYTTGDIKQVYIMFGDIIKWAFSDTGTNVLIFDTVR